MLTCALVAAALMAAIPFPTNAARVFIEADTAKGAIEVVTFNEGWVLLRPKGESIWLGPFPDTALDSLNPIDGMSIAGATFCVSSIVKGPMGMTAKTPAKKVVVLVEAPTLSQAVSEAHDQIVAALPPGVFKVPCP